MLSAKGPDKPERLRGLQVSIHHVQHRPVGFGGPTRDGKDDGYITRSSMSGCMVCSNWTI